MINKNSISVKSLKVNENLNDDNNNNKEKIFMNLYPSIVNDFSPKFNYYQSKFSNFTKIKRKNKRLTTNEEKEKENLLDKDGTYKINDFFLDLIIKERCPLNKKKVYLTISKYIKNSFLFEKIEKENQTDNNETPENLCLTIAQNMSYIEYKKYKSIYKVGDIGDKLYLIIKGKVNMYKPVKIKCKMSFKDYLLYCLLLNKYKEEYLLNKMLMTYVKTIPIMFIDEIKKAFNILFKIRLFKKIKNEKITNNRELRNYFEKNEMNFDDFNIDIRKLDQLLHGKTSKKNIINIKDENENSLESQDWKSYILNNCTISFGETNYIEKFDKLLKNKKKMDIECYIFEYSGTVEKGKYFGDLPIDNDGSFLKKEREYSIFAVEDTVIGSIKNEDFIYIIAPKIKIEKIKNVNFINDNYFFKAINNYIFTKNYFQYFKKRELSRDNVLFEINSIPKSLFLLKEGNISLSIKCSLIQLNDIISNLYIKLVTNKYYSEMINKKFISKDIIDIVKNYANDYFLKNLKLHNEKFIKEIKKIRNFQISIVSRDEIIGLEEIFFNISYIMKGVAISEKCIFYELPIDKLDYIINIETIMEELYIKTSVNKLLSLIERLQNLKQNVIDILKKRDKMNFNDNNEDSLKNNNQNNQNMDTIKNNNSDDDKSNSMEKINIKTENNLINDDNDNNNAYLKTINSENIYYNQGNYKPYKRGFSSIKKQKINYQILENMKNEEKNDDNNNSIYNIENKKYLKHAKSAKRLTIKKEKNLYIENFEEKGRVGSADFYRLNKRNKKGNVVDAIFIIDKYYTLDAIKKTIERNKNKIKLVNKLYKNQNISKTVDKKKYYGNELEPKVDEIEENSNANTINMEYNHYKNHKIINPDKDIDNNLFKRINLKLNIDNNNKNFKTINENNNDNNNENRINIFKKNVNKSNKNIIIPKKSEDNKVVNEDNRNRLIISNNFLFSKSPSKLPKLKMDLQNNININLDIIKSGAIIDNIILKSKKSIIPKIVKNFYDNKKSKGYIPFIANKESNTLFLRKYHQKYNKNILNTESNLKSLPKIYKHIPFNK